MNLITSIKNFIVNYKKTAIAIAVIIVAGTWYALASSTPTVTTYTLGTVSRGTVVATVTGTGQVSSVNQITIPAKTGGEITSLRVLPGDQVSQGQIIATIDNRSLRISLDQAKSNLEKAKRNLSNDIATYNLSFQNQLISLNSSLVAQPSTENATAAAPTVSGTYNSTEKGEYKLRAYDCARGICVAYSGIESGNELIPTNIAFPIGTRGVYVKFATLPQSGDQWTITVPSPLSGSYLSQTQNIASAQQSHEISVANGQSSIRDAEIALESAQYNYDNSFVRAPIGGIIGQVSTSKGQTVSSGTTVATLVGTEQYVDVSFNEVDVAKISLGDRATATFDAIEDLMITGRVASIDQIGTVSSGVVNYTVRIVFDTNDERVKSGMSTSITISTDTRADVLTVPNSAIKTSGGSSYVLTATSETDPSPVQVTVEVGLADDTLTEITSGLTEGQSIVTRTTTSNTTATTGSSAPSILNAVGGSTRGGTSGVGSMRALTR